MQVEAIFKEIGQSILEEIQEAQKSIFIAVAWFTNKNLFNALVQKANEGCNVSLMISNDNINLDSYIDLELLNVKSSRVYLIGDGDTDLMHNKFCVIDYSTTITGSYNWSYKAERNFENIVITRNDTALAEQFIVEFNNIKKKYYPEEKVKEQVFPIDKILKRLEIIQNLILLEDVDDVRKAVGKIEIYTFNSDLKEIIEDIVQEEYGNAIQKIQLFISSNRQLISWNDPEVSALKLEIKKLENQLNAFDNEKVELEKFLSEFQRRHAIELGKLILDILNLRKLKFKNDKEKFKEAEKDEREYKKHIEDERKKDVQELTKEEKLELKKKYRKASLSCHPDKFVNEPIEIQNQVKEIFQELNEANSKNDLKRVTEILENLQRGIFTTERSNRLTDKEKLRLTISLLRSKLKKLEAELKNIKESESYRTLVNIKDWEEYFRKTKEKLEEEFQNLKQEVEL